MKAKVKVVEEIVVLRNIKQIKREIYVLLILSCIKHDTDILQLF